MAIRVVLNCGVSVRVTRFVCRLIRTRVMRVVRLVWVVICLANLSWTLRLLIIVFRLRLLVCYWFIRVRVWIRLFGMLLIC